jgi:hypothetical protein
VETERDSNANVGVKVLAGVGMIWSRSFNAAKSVFLLLLAGLFKGLIRYTVSDENNLVFKVAGIELGKVAPSEILGISAPTLTDRASLDTLNLSNKVFPSLEILVRTNRKDFLKCIIITPNANELKILADFINPL